MTRELIIGSKVYGVAKITLSTWDREIPLDRIKVDISVPDEDTFRRADPAGTNRLREFPQKMATK
jgi:hypothetical protein